MCCWDRMRHRNKPLVPWWVGSPLGFLGVCLNLAITHYRCTANLNHGPTSRSELSSLPTTHSGVAVLRRVCPVDAYPEVLGFLTNAFPSSPRHPLLCSGSISHNGTDKRWRARIDHERRPESNYQGTASWVYSALPLPALQSAGLAVRLVFVAVGPR